MVHADYCLLRDSHDDDNIAVCVGRMNPSKAMLAARCIAKGPGDAHAVGRRVEFLKDGGVHKITYRSDQEASIVALIEAALKESGEAGQVTEASP